MMVDIENEVAGLIPPDFEKAAACCEKAEQLRQSPAVHVLLTDDETIHRINLEQRKIDRSTDVLSFPTVNYPKGKKLKDCPELLKREYDADLGACMLGDIVISYEHAKAQAEEYGHSLQRELCYLFVHGIFHLMGYDHMQEDEKKEMREKEEEALKMAGITRENEEQNVNDEELLAYAREAMKNSYSPYSHYAVGAALLAKDGRIFRGCNIENASFGVTMCAERTALFKAVSEGVREFEAIAIASDGSMPYPCGVCRQALYEFAPSLRVLVIDGEGQVDKTTLPLLLPHGFGPKDLA